MIKSNAVLCCLLLSLGIVTAVHPANAQEAATAPSGEQAQIAAGDRHFNAGEMDKAVQAYRRAVESAPRDALAHYKLGVALGRINKYGEAIQQLEAAVKLEPANVRFERTLAGAYEVRGMIEKAQAAYQRVAGMTANPKIIADANKRFTLITAKAYTEQGNPAAALTLLNDLLREKGRDPEVLYYIGIVQMLSNHLDDAESAFEEVIGLLPRNLNAYLNLVKVLEKKNEIEKAIAYQEKLLDLLSPGSKEHREQTVRLELFKGRRALEQGDITTAEKVFKEALSLSPRDPYANYGLGVVYQQERRLRDAAERFEKVLSAMPGHLDARLRLGTIYLELNQVQEGVGMLQALISKAGSTPQGQQARNILARLKENLQRRRGQEATVDARIQELKAMIARDPRQVQARMQLGELYLKKGDLKSAREQYEAVVKIEPQNENAHGNLGQIYEDLGSYKKAQEEYAMAVALEPKPERAAGIAKLILLASGRQYFAEEHLDQAEAVFNQVLDEDPENTTALFYSGLIHMNRDELENAVAVFKTLLGISPNNLAVRINLALTYERLNKEYDAIHEYRYIIRQSPDSKISKEAEVRLKRAEKSVKGFFSTMNYRLVFDSNSNLSSRSSRNYRTDVLFNLAYRYKTDNDYRLSVSWAPDYTVYHVGQFDFLTNSLTVSLAKVFARRTLSGGYTYRIQNGLLSGVRVSTSGTLFFEADQTFRMPSIIKWDTEHPVNTSTRLNFYYTDLSTSANRFFSAQTITLGLSFDQQIDARQGLGLSYYYTRNRNKDPVGSDNAYNSQHLVFNYQRRLFPRVVGSISYNLLYYHYINPDSFSNFTKRRSNLTNMISANLTYNFRPNMNFYLNYIFEKNNSNLPVGFVFSAQQRAEGQQNNAPGTIIGVQSSALGDFSRQAVTAGMTWSF